MTKEEYIEKHGEEAYTRLLEKNREYYKKNKESIYKKHKDRYETEKESILNKQKKYNNEHKTERASYCKKYWQDNKGKLSESQHKYYEENKTSIKERERKKRSTKEGRAVQLLYNYCNFDKVREYETDLSENFIIENIFNSSCIYCGETDWHKLGCDRIDNTKGHTTDNVVCSCLKCNVKRRVTPFRDFLLSQNPSAASEILASLGLLN